MDSRHDPPSGETPPHLDHIAQNIESVVSIHQRHQDQLTPFERRLEGVSGLISRPAYLFTLIGVVLAWVGINALAIKLGRRPLDAPPFEILQGVLTLASLATTTIVVITQRRQARLESRRAYLDLQVNLLTEQKVTKVIHLLEELRRDLPMVRNRVDAEADVMQRPANTEQVLSALEHVGVGTAADPAAGHL